MMLTITITKTKLALSILVAALLVPATAWASHVFDDVPDDKFYAGPVEWAYDNNITTGKTATSFAPDDNVTRGESVTFLQRYNDNIVDPAINDLESDIADNATDIADLASDVAAEAGAARVAGVAQPDFAPAVTIDTTSTEELTRLTLPTVMTRDVAIDAHVYVERVPSDDGRYDFTLHLDGCGGEIVGRTLWRPISSGDAYQADVISFTGWAPDVPAGSDLVLCGRKFDSFVPNAVAGMRGMTAQW